MTFGELTPRQKAYREGLQSILDGTKHITTLTTGSIVIITTFLGRLQSTPASSRLFTSAIALFVLSILSSIVTIYEINKIMLELVLDHKNTPFYWYLAQIIFFGSGLSVLAIFAALNF